MLCLECIAERYSLGLRAFRTSLLRWGLRTLQPGAGLSGAAPTSEGKKAPSEGQGHSAGPTLSSGARSKRIYRLGTRRVSSSPIQNRGRVKFKPQPTHLHPRQHGLRVAPCSLQRPSPGVGAVGAAGSGRHTPPDPGHSGVHWACRRSENGEEKSSERLEGGEMGFQSTHPCTVPTLPTWAPRSLAASTLCPFIQL